MAHRIETWVGYRARDIGRQFEIHYARFDSVRKGFVSR